MIDLTRDEAWCAVCFISKQIDQWGAGSPTVETVWPEIGPLLGKLNAIVTQEPGLTDWLATNNARADAFRAQHIA